MNETTAVAQEDIRAVTVSARVTKAEKDALKIVAAMDQTTESDLLRDATIATVMARAEEIRGLRDHLRSQGNSEQGTG